MHKCGRADIIPFPEHELIRFNGRGGAPDGDVDDGASCADGEHGLLQPGLHPRGIKGHVDARIVGQFVDAGDDVVYGGIEDVVGAERGGELFAARGDFGDDDGADFSGFEDLDQLGGPDQPERERKGELQCSLRDRWVHLRG